MARQGLGCTLVGINAVKSDIRAHQLVPIVPELEFGWLSIEAVLRDQLPSPEARAFVAFMYTYQSDSAEAQEDAV